MNIKTMVIGKTIDIAVKWFFEENHFLDSLVNSTSERVI